MRAMLVDAAPVGQPARNQLVFAPGSSLPTGRVDQQNRSRLALPPGPRPEQAGRHDTGVPHHDHRPDRHPRHRRAVHDRRRAGPWRAGRGRRRAGLHAGHRAHLVLALSGAAVLLAASPMAFAVLTWLGVAYLL